MAIINVNPTQEETAKAFGITLSAEVLNWNFTHSWSLSLLAS